VLLTCLLPFLATERSKKVNETQVSNTVFSHLNQGSIRSENTRNEKNHYILIKEEDIVFTSADENEFDKHRYMSRSQFDKTFTLVLNPQVGLLYLQAQTKTSLITKNRYKSRLQVSDWLLQV